MERAHDILKASFFIVTHAVAFKNDWGSDQLTVGRDRVNTVFIFICSHRQDCSLLGTVLSACTVFHNDRNAVSIFPEKCSFITIFTDVDEEGVLRADDKAI